MADDAPKPGRKASDLHINTAAAAEQRVLAQRCVVAAKARARVYCLLPRT